MRALICPDGKITIGETYNKIYVKLNLGIKYPYWYLFNNGYVFCRKQASKTFVLDTHDGEFTKKQKHSMKSLGML